MGTNLSDIVDAGEPPLGGEFFNRLFSWISLFTSCLFSSAVASARSTIARSSACAADASAAGEGLL